MAVRLRRSRRFGYSVISSSTVSFVEAKCVSVDFARCKHGRDWMLDFQKLDSVKPLAGKTFPSR